MEARPNTNAILRLLLPGSASRSGQQTAALYGPVRSHAPVYRHIRKKDKTLGVVEVGSPSLQEITASHSLQKTETSPNTVDCEVYRTGQSYEV
jgi:hypothetical protein